MFRDVWPMLNGAIRDIVINNCSSATFQELLRFCYTDTAILNRDNVFDVMACAKMYEIKELEDLCCTFCVKYLNVSNVCEQYKKCYMLDNELSRKCLNIFNENILDLLDNKSFFFWMILQ